MLEAPTSENGVATRTEAQHRPDWSIRRWTNESIVSTGAELTGEFASAKPFPHILFKDLFARELLEEVLHEFDTFAQWQTNSDGREETNRSKGLSQFGPATQTYFDIVNSTWFVRFLSDVSGIPALLPDPLLRGGGLHESRRGGKFDLHIDFNKHPVNLLDNRLVLITYLNHDWRREYGGILELWDMEKNECGAEVMPHFGHSILFAHSDRSLHGHPRGLNPPEGRTRRSVAAYYYTNGRDDAAARQRFGTFFAAPPPKNKLKSAARAIVPPIILDAARTLRDRIAKKDE